MENTRIPEYILKVINSIKTLNELHEKEINEFKIYKEKSVHFKNDNLIKNKRFYLQLKDETIVFDKETLPNFSQLIKQEMIYQDIYDRSVNRSNLVYDLKLKQEVDFTSNQKHLNINFLIRNNPDVIKKVTTLIDSLFDLLPSTFSASHLNFNIIIIFYFEYCGDALNFKNNNISSKLNINFYQINYNKLKSFMSVDTAQKVFITNKLKKCLYIQDLPNEIQSISKEILNFITKKELSSSLTNYNQALNFIGDEDTNHKQSKSFLLKLENEMLVNTNFRTKILTSTFKYIKEYKLNNNDISVKYNQIIVDDQSFIFNHSNIHNLLSKNSQYFTRNRFSTGINKQIKQGFLSEFQSILLSKSLKENVEIRKKTSYSIENFSKTFIFKNSIGKNNNNEILRSYKIHEIYDKLRNLKKSSFEKLGKLDFNNSYKSLRLKFYYKIFKSKSKKSISIDCLDLESQPIKLENIIGTNYLFYYFDKENDAGQINYVIRFLIALNKFYETQKIKIVFVILIGRFENSDDLELKDYFLPYKEVINIYLVDADNKKILDNIYNYTNNKSFLFIDSEGNLNNFSFIYNFSLIYEKIEDLLRPKKEINQKAYYQIKKYLLENIIDFDYKDRFNYKPKFMVSLEKRTIYNPKLEVIQKKYFSRGYVIVNDDDSFKLNHLEDDLNAILRTNCLNFDIITNKKLQSTFTINLDLSLICQFCKSDCGRFSVYFCPFCKYFICENCAKALSKPDAISTDSMYQSCFQHNIILLFDVQSIKKSRTNLTFDNFKIGSNLFSQTKLEPSIFFSCNMCKENYETNRFMCLNCRGPEMFYDIENSGYIDICEFCVEKYTAYYKAELEENDSNLQRSLEEEILNDEEHHMRNHVYLRIYKSSGYYYLN